MGLILESKSEVTEVNSVKTIKEKGDMKEHMPVK
jgi:hypothetical protein